MSSYSEALRDPRWQRRRLEKMQAAEWRCQKCGANHRPLHIHHKRYKANSAPWEYDDTELECLCEKCHRRAHFIAMIVEVDLSPTTEGFSKLEKYRASVVTTMRRMVGKHCGDEQWHEVLLQWMRLNECIPEIEKKLWPENRDAP